MASVTSVVQRRAVIVFAALGWECRSVLHALRGVRRMDLPTRAWRGEAGRGEVVVVQTGVGPAHAAAAVAGIDLTEFDLVVSTGCAGGLAPALRAGDLVVATAVQGDSGALDTDARPREQLLAKTKAAGVVLREGPIRCNRTMLTSRADKRAVAAGGALVVEMEAAPLMAAARRAGRPFVSLRAVIDNADDDVSVLARISDPASGNVRPLALLAHLLRHPGSVAELLAMRRAQVAAIKSLERLFALWLA